jgi:hypothetical protein
MGVPFFDLRSVKQGRHGFWIHLQALGLLQSNAYRIFLEFAVTTVDMVAYDVLIDVTTSFGLDVNITYV